jgi:hypothetical protein
MISSRTGASPLALCSSRISIIAGFIKHVKGYPDTGGLSKSISIAMEMEMEIAPRPARLYAIALPIGL